MTEGQGELRFDSETHTPSANDKTEPGIYCWALRAGRGGEPRPRPRAEAILEIWDGAPTIFRELIPRLRRLRVLFSPPPSALLLR